MMIYLLLIPALLFFSVFFILPMVKLVFCGWKWGIGLVCLHPCLDRLKLSQLNDRHPQRCAGHHGCDTHHQRRDWVFIFSVTAFQVDVFWFPF